MERPGPFAAALLLTPFLAACLLASRGGPAPGPPSEAIGLFDCQTAGNYRWIELRRNGSLTAIQAGSAWQLLDGRCARLPQDEVEELFRRLEEIEWERRGRLRARDTDPDEIVEDRVYSLLAGPDPALSFSAHESQLPPAVGRLVRSLEARAEEADRACGRPASYLLALPGSLATCLGQDAPRLPAGAESEPWVEQALAGWGAAVPIPPEVLPALRRQGLSTGAPPRMVWKAREVFLVLME